MEPCIDCGNSPKRRSRALFFDLDHSLVRPKVRTVKSSSFPEALSAEGVEAIKNNMLAKLGKNIEFVDFITPYDLDKEGYYIPILSYRPTFPKGVEDWEFIPGVLDALYPFGKAGFKLVIITNQGGIESKFHTEEEVEEKLSSILFNMAGCASGFLIEQMSYFYCPHLKAHPDRKPEPGMILRAAAKLNIDLSKSYFVGDMDSDKEAARRAEIPNYYDINVFLSLSPFVPLGVNTDE